MVKLPPSSPHSSDQAKEKESAYFRWEVWQWRRVALNAVWTVLVGGAQRAAKAREWECRVAKQVHVEKGGARVSPWRLSCRTWALQSGARGRERHSRSAKKGVGRLVRGTTFPANRCTDAPLRLEPHPMSASMLQSNKSLLRR